VDDTRHRAVSLRHHGFLVLKFKRSNDIQNLTRNDIEYSTYITSNALRRMLFKIYPFRHVTVICNR